LVEHLDNTGNEAILADADAPHLTILVVNYNTAHLLAPMYEAVRSNNTTLRIQWIIIDNASTDDSVAVLRRDFGFATLICNDCNVGFGRANNQGLAFAKGKYLLLLNTDAFVASDTIESTVNFMEAHPSCGILGIKLLGRDNELQPSCRYFPTPLNTFLVKTGLARFAPHVKLVDDMAWAHDQPRECDWVPGAYYLVRQQLVAEIGLFDPIYFLYFEEVDHCRRAQAAGWKIFFYPGTSAVHIGGESAKSVSTLTKGGRQISALQLESELLYFRKHFGVSGLVYASLLFHATLALKLLSSFKKRNWPAASSQAEHFKLYWHLLRCTRFASTPTR
jgi:N-acetylglucosaminyl-diphospho-decaprenol L-rhamnosyltransferase